MFLIDITQVQALPNRTLDLTFDNGFHGIVDMDRIVILHAVKIIRFSDI